MPLRQLPTKTFVGATLDYSPIEQIMRVIDATFREFVILKHKEKAENVLKQLTDARCDIYALGATFYHLLTNHLPIESTKRTLAIWENAEDPLPNPSELNPEIPPSISACLLKAMEIERDRRFSSANEMREALQTAIAEEKARKKENTLPLIEPKYLQIVAEKKATEQYLTQAVTDKLITEIEAKEKTDHEIILSDASAPTEYLKILSLDTQTGSDFSTMQESDFKKSESVSKSELTGKVYSEELLPEKKKAAIKPFPFTEKEIAEASENDVKRFRFLPIAALGILTIGGIGGMMWLNSSSSVDSTNKSAANVVISTPTVTPTTKLVIEPSVSPSILPTPAPTQNKPIIVDKVKPKPTVVPKRTPVIALTTPPIPTPKKTPNLSDDCIYNGKCK